MATRRSLVIYLPSMNSGGAERLHINLAPHFVAMGFDVIFLLDRLEGPLLDAIPDSCRILCLNASRQIQALPRLVAYLRHNRPDVLIGNMEHMNIMAILARRIAGVGTKVIVTQHNSVVEQSRRPSFKWRIMPWLYRRLLPMADDIVCVSVGVAQEMAATCGISRDRMRVIYNGLIDDAFDDRLQGTPDHTWFADRAPVVVAMGRLVPQKDFETLIRAFAMVPPPARLMILGEGPLEDELRTLTQTLGVGDRVAFAGFRTNPLPYLRMATLFVMSSRFEGFGNVLVEALASGTPVVSTDCPHGPSEILERGRFGRLVPVGDPTRLADAMIQALDATHDRDMLRARGAQFSVARCAENYARLMA
jgi:glycosyltransferase involved in cell wall biosynthesis